MQDQKSTRISNGVISGLTLICGIVLSVLIDQLLRILLNISTYQITSESFETTPYAYYGGSPLWSIGLAYIVPGLIGVIATVFGQRCGYILQMVLAIITLVVMGILFIFSLIILAHLSIHNYTYCTYSKGTCVCGSSFRAVVTDGDSCYKISTMSSMGIGICVMIVLGWIAVLAASITGGILGCSSEDSRGVVIHNSQQPPIAVIQMSEHQSSQPSTVHPGYAYSPQIQPNPYRPPPAYSFHGGSTVNEKEHDHEQLNM